MIAVTPPATKTIPSVSRRNATSGRRGPSVVPSQLPASEPGSQTRNAGERASVSIVWRAARIASPIALAPTKYIARSARKLRGEALSRARRRTGAAAVAGFFGGFLGASTSLNGVAPVLLLARDKASPRSFLADLAMYFVGANAIGLAILAARHTLRTDALSPAFLVWLPGSLLGNWLGTTLGPRLPEVAFRRLTLAIVFVAGGVTAITA